MDINGNVQGRAEYDGFGKMIKFVGPMTAKNNYWYSGKEYVSQAGMYGFGYRFYEANFQRWLNRDPIGEPGFEAIRRINPLGGIRNGGLQAEITQGPNLYTFVDNSPVNYIDPLGLQVPPEAMDEMAQLSEELQPEEEALEAEAEKAWEAFAQKFADLVQKAREAYPKLCGKFQWHHPTPKYLGGDPNQPLVLLEAPYHQMITTAFRTAYPYGQGAPSDPTTVVNVVNTVYSTLPLPK
jgi:RHS repeat-associated protein